MTTSVLSPMATPFQPSSPPSEPEEFEFAIFNDGVPSLVGHGANWEHMILHNIPDEALDEAFPPTAQEVAEMEAAEDFVQSMVNLDIMEEREEEARASFVHIRKRWEARREDGLVGKPNPPRHVLPSKTNTHIRETDETDLVPYDTHRSNNMAMANLESRLRSKEEAKRHNKDRLSNKKLTGLRGHKPIQQPCKGR